MPVLGFYSHKGPLGFLSNFYPTPFTFALPTNAKIHGGDLVCVSHSEQAIMLTKAALFGDERRFKAILSERRPAVCKRLGRQVCNFNDAIWSAQLLPMAIHILLAKFSSTSDLANKLTATAPAVLAEASPYDQIWGIGLSTSDPRVQDPSQWRGKNILGQALTVVRSKLSS
jgi:ribA/ribD-fused uncharacterized protein